ncbi:hypothetical protein [Candidatus Cyanaurora vandensis]|uniref:hypothetical protein n=1 Tax=Candidatus Cyanaurora vandensis TaxID=2714958 RepID=UPI00257BED1C|nr:hypothetical protein [Candidatus Cyanaurora vandensis]
MSPNAILDRNAPESTRELTRKLVSTQAQSARRQRQGLLMRSVRTLEAGVAAT